MQVILAILFAGGMQSALSAAITCTNADYVGHYAFSSVGSLVDLPPQGAIFLGTISQAGRFNPDGKGNVPIETFASYNGYETNGYTPGATYSVSPDCVVSFNLTLPLPLGAPSQFEGILSEHGTQMVLMLTVPQGTVIIGQHIKQDLLFCGLTDFSGAFQVRLDRHHFQATNTRRTVPATRTPSVGRRWQFHSLADQQLQRNDRSRDGHRNLYDQLGVLPDPDVSKRQCRADSQHIRSARRARRDCHGHGSIRGLGSFRNLARAGRHGRRAIGNPPVAGCRYRQQ